MNEWMGGGVSGIKFPCRPCQSLIKWIMEKYKAWKKMGKRLRKTEESECRAAT